MTEAPHRPADSIAIGGSNSKDDAVLLCYNRLPKRTKFSYEELEECKEWYDDSCPKKENMGKLIKRYNEIISIIARYEIMEKEAKKNKSELI